MAWWARLRIGRAGGEEATRGDENYCCVKPSGTGGEARGNTGLEPRTTTNMSMEGVLSNSISPSSFLDQKDLSIINKIHEPILLKKHEPILHKDTYVEFIYLYIKPKNQQN